MLNVFASTIGALTLGATVSLSPARDNTLYQFSPAEISNGAGQYFFAGTDANGNKRRGVIAFDFSSIPQGSTVTAVTLNVFMSRTTTFDVPVSLHRALANWGEGISDADFEEGGGTAATPGDATWEHRFFPDVFWATVGGDFTPAPSVTRMIGGVGPYSFASSPQFVADVQSWVDAPASNFGWIMVGLEAGNRTAKRFDSRENPLVENRPVLVVEFTPPACPGDADGDGMIGLSDIASVINCWGMPASCDPAADLDGSGDVGLGDLAEVIKNWDASCG